MKKELLSIMFLLGVSIALINITPEINQIDSAAPHLKENKDINLGVNENKKFENSATPVTFDIIRISQHGDTVMAGKSEPNLEIFLFENKKYPTTRLTSSAYRFGRWTDRPGTSFF